MPTVALAKVSLNKAPIDGAILSAPSCNEPDPDRDALPRMIEGFGEFDIDGRADRACRQRHIGGLEHAQRADEIGADGAEIDRAAARRGRDAAAVIERLVEEMGSASCRERVCQYG